MSSLYAHPECAKVSEKEHLPKITHLYEYYSIALTGRSTNITLLIAVLSPPLKAAVTQGFSTLYKGILR